MPRLFTGLEIPKTIADRLMLLRGEIPGARWVEPANYHITLRFLGDVSHAVASEFAARIGDLPVAPFDVALKGVGSFGSKRPHTLWVGAQPNDAMAALARAHEKAAIAVGLAPETRHFTPHVTLARLSRTRADDLARFLGQFSDFSLDEFAATRAALYSSRPSTGGGPYVVEDVFPFEE